MSVRNQENVLEFVNAVWWVMGITSSQWELLLLLLLSGLDQRPTFLEFSLAP